MATLRPKVLVAGSQVNRDLYLAQDDLDKLSAFADWQWHPCEEGKALENREDEQGAIDLQDQVADIDALVVYPGAPRIDAQLIDRACKLQIIGELNGDRFAERIDLQVAWERGIRTVDTTNGSSYPLAEWALGLILVSLRNAGHYMRQFIAGKWRKTKDNIDFSAGELTGKRVGLIGCGHAGRRLIELLLPFRTDIFVYDPYLPNEMAEALGFVQTSLDNVLSQCDVVVCLVPQTPLTQGMIGQRELDLMPSGTVLINVSRGAVIDSTALVARLKRGDIVAGLDVFDPEPIADKHEITSLDNVFLTPHIGGVTAAGYRRFFKLMVEELDRFFGGHKTYFDLTPRTLANRQGSEPIAT